MDESAPANEPLKAMGTPSDTKETNENSTTKTALENNEPTDEPMEVDTEQTNLPEQPDKNNATENEEKSIDEEKKRDELVEQNEKSLPLEETSEPDKKDERLSQDANVAESVAADSEQKVLDTEKSNEKVESDNSPSETGDTNIPPEFKGDEAVKSDSIEDNENKECDASISEEMKDTSDNVEDSKGVIDSKDCETKLESEQDVDGKEEKESQGNELKEDENKEEKAVREELGGAEENIGSTNQAESVENVQKYIDETSQEELVNVSPNSESIPEKNKADIDTEGESGTKPVLKESDTNEELATSHEESTKKIVKDIKIMDGSSENVLGSSVEASALENETIEKQEIPGENCATNEPMDIDTVDSDEKQIPSPSTDAPTSIETQNLASHEKANMARNKSQNLAQKRLVPSGEPQNLAYLKKVNLASDTTHNLLKNREARKFSGKRRHDPAIGQPLSLSKLYYLDAEKDFKGFLAEYYDSTIYMYRGYWSYVQEEFGIQARPLPKYKTNFYTSHTAAPGTPMVHTSSGRVVKKKEMKEFTFTPSVPSSHQVRKEKEAVSTPKRESPVAKKEKKEPREENSKQRYRTPLEKFGWKREVVFRSGHGGDQKVSADVYYYSPAGKKLRSIREIIDHLPDSEELRPFHFTFVRELLGYGSPLEISRDAVSRTLTGDEDTPKRTKASGNKTGGVQRKVFSASVTNKTDPIKVLNGKVKKPPPRSAAMKRTCGDSESDDDSADSTPEKPSPTKKYEDRRATPTKPSNGVVFKSEGKTNRRSSLFMAKVKSPADVKHRKLSIGVKSSSDLKKQPETTQSENQVPNSLASKHKANSVAKSPIVNKKRRLDVQQDVPPVVKQVAQPAVVPPPPVPKIPHCNKNLINDMSNQFNAVVHLCKYLRVEDLLRVARVNRMFNAAAHAHQLWQVVKLKNSKVRDWGGLADCLIRHGTHTLDMLKMICSTDPDENDEIWNRFYKVIGKIHSLKRLELGRVTAAEILNAASNCSKNLTEFSVIAQKLATIDLKLFQGLPNLEILQLRSFESKREHGLIMMNIPMLAHMGNLRHLSLTGVKNLKSYQVNVFKDFPPLASLELGDCTKLDDRFPECSLAHLTSLVRLRLEMVQGNMANKFVEVIATLPRLRTLELINIDTKKGFDEVFGRLSRVEHVLIFPTYITQSSTTNWLVLSGLAKLKTSLKFLTWGLTQELLRVTTLFIEQWNAQLNLDEGVSKLDPEELKKTIVESNSIPVMKPLPELFEKVHSAGKSQGSAKQNISELDILPIDELKTMLEKVLCETKIKLITVPVSSTTRIYLPSN